jgi:hypothetical protein
MKDYEEKLKLYFERFWNELNHAYMQWDRKNPEPLLKLKEEFLGFIAQIIQEEKEKTRRENIQMRYEFYNDYGKGYLAEFLEKNPEFNTPEFIEYVIANNRGDGDAGELDDIAKHEILRLAYEFEEKNGGLKNEVKIKN